MSSRDADPARPRSLTEVLAALPVAALEHMLTAEPRSFLASIRSRAKHRGGAFRICRAERE